MSSLVFAERVERQGRFQEGASCRRRFGLSGRWRFGSTTCAPCGGSTKGAWGRGRWGAFNPPASTASPRGTEGARTGRCALWRARAARGVRVRAAASTVDHIAFPIDCQDFESERSRLEGLGLTVETADQDWVHWRSLYIHDPEGNEVELVCYDPSV